MSENEGIKKVEEAFKDKRIEKNSGGEAADKVVYLNLGSACNQNCLFCLIKGSEHNFPYMSLEQAKETAMRFVKAGGESIMITGGEPSLRKDLPELIFFIGNIPEIKSVSIITNGTGFSDPEYTKAIMEADRNNKLMFSVSLHSHDAAIADKITAGSEGDFEKTVAGIDNILSYNKMISIYHVIVTDNYKLLPDFVRWASERFPKIKFFVFAYPFPQGNAERNEWIYMRFTELKPYLMETLKELERKDCMSDIATCGQFPLCVITGFEEKVVNPLIFYKKNVAGTVGSKVFHETEWSAKEWINSFKSKPDSCRGCVLNQVCQGFWKRYVSSFGFDGAEPVTEESFSGNKIEADIRSESDISRTIDRMKMGKFTLIVAKGNDQLIDCFAGKVSERGFPCVIINK